MSELSSDEIKKIKEYVLFQTGVNIRRIRTAKKITQIELAARIQSDRQYLYKIENGKVGVSVAKLATIAKALEVPI